MAWVAFVTVQLDRVDRYDGTVDPEATERNFETLAQLVPGTGGKAVEIRFGTGSVVFSAGVSSATTTVAHGLGRAPASINATGSNGSAIIMAVNSADATNIVFHADYFSALTGTFNFYWIAIG